MCTIDTATLKPIRMIAVGPRAWWMAAVSDMHLLYVTVGRANEVVAIDTGSNSVAAPRPAGGLPWGRLRYSDAVGARTTRASRQGRAEIP